MFTGLERHASVGAGSLRPQAQPNEEDIIQAVNEDTYWTEEQWIHNAGPGAVSMYPLYLAKEIRGWTRSLRKHMTGIL